MASEAAGPFHVLAKPTGARCNLDCNYCFYLDREALYPGSRFRMPDEVLEAWLRQLFAVHAREAVVPVAFQGGEPTLMGLEFFERAAALARSLARPGQRAELSLQSNGLLLDERWARFLRAERVLVGLSIDGPEAVHDRWRVDRSGRGSHARVERAARLLLESGVDVNAMVCVHAANQDQPLEVYDYLTGLGFRHIQHIPIVEPGPPEAPDRVGPRTVDPGAWGRFLIATFDRWVRADVGRVFFPTFESALAAWMGLQPSMCVFRETCGDALALEHNGDLYSCDHFVDPAHRLGNVLEGPMAELARQDLQRAFGRAKAELPGLCQRCEVRFACRGECPKNRILHTPEGEAGLSWLCAGYKAFFTHIDRPMRLLAGLLREGLPSENIMGLLAALEGRAGPMERHAPCPCGSGRKFRKCHGNVG